MYIVLVLILEVCSEMNILMKDIQFNISRNVLFYWQITLISINLWVKITVYVQTLEYKIRHLKHEAGRDKKAKYVKVYGYVICQIP